MDLQFLLLKLLSASPLILLPLFAFSRAPNFNLDGPHLAAGYSLIIVLCAELSSFFDLCNPQFLSAAWIFAALPLTAALFYFRIIALDPYWINLDSGPLSRSRTWVLIAALCILLFVLSFVLSRNTDSYVGHIPRVYNWLQNGRVFNFFAADIRQISTPPLAAYFLLPSIALGTNHDVAGLLQWSCYLVCIAYLARAALEITDSKEIGGLACIIFATIPIVVLEARTTQIDLVNAAFVLMFVDLSLTVIRSTDGGKPPNGIDLAFLPLIAGLIVCAKGLGLVFVLPLAAILAFKTLRFLTLRSLALIVVGVVLGSAVTAPFHWRQMDLFDSASGPLFGGMTWRVVEPSAPWLHYKYYISQGLHQLSTLFYGDPSANRTRWLFHEDVSAYAPIFAAFAVASVYNLANGTPKVRLITWVALIGWCLYSYSIVLMAPNTRLLIPWYALASLVIATAAARLLSVRIWTHGGVVVAHGVVGLSAAVFSVYNPTFPLQGATPWWKMKRVQQSSVGDNTKIEDYLRSRSSPKRIGLALAFADEASYWYILSNIYGNRRPVVRALYSNHESLFPENKKINLPGYVADQQMRDLDIIIVKVGARKVDRLKHFEPYDVVEFKYGLKILVKLDSKNGPGNH